MLIGLTGGVASGKTLVSSEFRRLGAFIIDADEAAREVVSCGSGALEEIASAFGREMLRPDRTLDRKRLGRLVFSDKEALSKLNAIVHPKIRKRIEESIEAAKAANPDAIIVVDAALLIENGLYKLMDSVVLVRASARTRVERLMKRDGLSMEEAKRILDAQMSDEEKQKFADFTIDNDGSEQDASTRAKEVFEELLKKRC